MNDMSATTTPTSPAVDAAANVGSLRTLGTGPLQACAGDDARLGGGGGTQRDALMRTALGYITETFPRAMRATQFVMVTGRRYYTPFAILAGETVSAIDFGCHAAGSALTMVKFGVVSLDFATLHAVSADEKAQYTSTGLKTNNMLTPWVSPSDQVVYGCLFALGTTCPSGDSTHGAGKNANQKRAGAAAGPCAQLNAQSDLVAGGSPVFDGNAITFWLGMS